MVTITRLNNTLKSVANTVNVGELNSAFQSSIDNFLSAYQAKGKIVGEIEQGLEIIADEGLSSAKDTLLPIVGKLSEQVALELKRTSTQKGNIATITGISVDDGFLESAISNINSIGIDNLLSAISNDKAGISRLVQSFSNNGGNALNALLDAVSPQGVAKDAITQAFNISDTTVDLATLIKNETDIDLTSAVTGDTNIKNSIERDLTTKIKTSQLSNPSIVNSIKSFNGKDTPDSYEFTFVNTVEELMLEFRNSEREFSHIIVDYTKEYLDDNFDAKDFHRLYSSIEFAGGDDEETLEVIPGKGFDGIPYHYLIRKDGRTQRGRPLDIEEKKFGNSIVVAIPGGYDVPRSSEEYLKVNSSTTTSWYWFNSLLYVAYTMFPGIQVFASDELKEIGWDADVYIASLFGKKNNVDVSKTLTRDTLISTRLDYDD
jgi:hypothetical protein